MAAPRIIPALGFFKAIVLGLVVVAVMLIALPAFRSFETWLVIRFLLGMGNSLLFTAGDTWVNQIVNDRVRGRWMGIYVTAGMAGWAVGPLLGAYLDPGTYWPFVWGLLAIVVAAGFLLPTWKLDVRLSAPEQGVARGLAAVFLAAPTVLLSSAMFGVLEGTMQSFAHLYTMDVLGAQFRQTGYAVIWVGSVAAVFFQYPIGWLADKVNRSWLLIVCVLALMVSNLSVSDAYRRRARCLVATTGTGAMGRGQYLGWFHGGDLHRWHYSAGRTFRDVELVSAKRCVFRAVWCRRSAWPIPDRHCNERNWSRWLPVVATCSSRGLRVVCALSAIYPQIAAFLLSDQNGVLIENIGEPIAAILTRH